MRPRQPYLQPHTLRVVRRRSAIRLYLRQEESELRRRRLLLGMAAFIHLRAGSFFSRGARQVAELWFRDLDVSIARALDELNWLTASVRSLVRQDRVAYLEGLVSHLSLADVRQPRELYAAVRRAFPGARAARRATFQALPAIRLADGTMAIDSTARSQRWAEHFAAQEAGEPVSLQDYQDRFPSLQPNPYLAGPHFEVTALPTLHDLEQQILALPARKAVGPDGVAAELLQVSAVHSAAVLFPIFLKSSLGLRNPRPGEAATSSAWLRRPVPCLTAQAFGRSFWKVYPGSSTTGFSARSLRHVLRALVWICRRASFQA